MLQWIVKPTDITAPQGKSCIPTFCDKLIIPCPPNCNPYCQDCLRLM